MVGQRDRALIALMVYGFARVGAVLGMRVEDFYVQGRRGWVRPHEKGGKLHEMPTHHNLDKYLEAYIASAATAIPTRSSTPSQGASIGATEIYVAVPADRDPQSVRHYSTFTEDSTSLLTG